MISILLATYNSGKYIQDQIESILNQTYKDWILVIRDDVSSDSTPQIIECYKKNYPNKILVLDNNGVSLRAYHNFVELLKNVECDYYMFCDHDDIWLPNKIELSIKRMKEVEEPNRPVIVHTDMKVVDERLSIIHPSFWKYSKLLPDRTSFEEMVLCNSANGCTMLFNKKAKEVSMPNVEYAKMHDILLNQSVSAYGGIISAIYEPTVLYRQHTDNVVGAQKRSFKFYLKKMGNIRFLVTDNIDTWKQASRIKAIPIYLFLWTKVKIGFLKIFV